MLEAALTQEEQNHAAGDEATFVAQNWKLLKQFNIYRTLMAAALLSVALVPGVVPPFGETAPGWFVLSTLLYTIAGITALFTIRTQTLDFSTQATLLAFIDIILITVIMHTSGGMQSGLGLLLLVAIAESSVLLNRHLTIFYASLATVAALVEHSWGALTGSIDTPFGMIAQGYPQVGMLGIGLFITGTLGNTLSQRLRSTAALAEKRGLDLANLASVNELIIARMQSGVLVCDAGGRVRDINRAARIFLDIDNLPPNQLLSELAPELAEQLHNWSANPAQRSVHIVRTTAGFALLPRFILLGDVTHRLGALIFLEDTEALKQQAQQLKMAALARLTASIAHEIRNPLSAISNAAQLLKESITADGEVQRLLKIIENHSNRMNVIVENITQLARRDRTDPVRLRVGDWLEEFITQYTQGIEIPTDAFSIQIAEPEIEACIDPDQLYQVIANLCQNALRHSPAFTGKPLVKIQTYYNKRGRPIIDIVDWGNGVPTDIIDNIFDPFFTTTPQGTGLGLYICRELCEGNSGRLEYLPNAVKGSIFRISLARADECYAVMTL